MSSYRPLRFLDASARADEIVANYKLGIGTHSQSSEVHVLADAPEIRIQDEVSEVTETALRITADGGAVSFQSGVDFTNDSKGDIKFESMLGATTHMTIDGTNSRVGIGTTNPRTYLHLSANNGDPLVTEGDFIGTHTLTEYLRFTSMGDSGDVNAVSVGFKLGADDNSDASPDGRLDICANDGSIAGNSYGFVPDRTIATFLGGGRVGIGLTNPSRPLTVESSDFYLLNLKRTTAGGGSALEIVNGDDDKWTVGTGGTGTFGIYNGSTFGEQFTIDTNGYVGIGRTVPVSLFNTFAGSLYNSSDSTYSSKVVATFEVGRGGGSNRFDQGTGAIIELRHDNDDHRYVTVESVSEATYSDDIGLRFKTVDDSITGPVERMRIDAHGKVGIGLTNPSRELEVSGTIATKSAVGNAGRLMIARDSDGSYLLMMGTGDSFNAAVAPANELAFINYGGGGQMSFYGNYDNDDNKRHGYFNAGKLYLEYTIVQNHAGTNFTGQHRTFVKDQCSVTCSKLHEGLIVSACHDEYVRMDNGIATGAEAITINECLPVVSLSNISCDKTCFGVISLSEDPDKREQTFGNFIQPLFKEKGDTRVFINSLGEGGIWVTNINGNIESGDYITTSNVAGYGMRQDDDVLHNYTVAKATMSCDFDPVTQPVRYVLKGEGDVTYYMRWTEIDKHVYDIVVENGKKQTRVETDENGKSTYYRRDETTEYKEGWETEVRREMVNVLDEHGQLQWEDHPTETEKAYRIRYLTADGQITDEANAVHIAAFVGCTYHCG